MQELKALEILKEIKNTFDENIVIGFTQKSINIDEAIEELEQYEQNFKQKEFDYRTKCQNILSSDRLSKDKNLSNLVNHAIELIPTNEEIAELIEEGIKNKAFALVISYQISGMINKKNIKCEYAFTKEEKEHLEEINSNNWRRIEKIYNLPRIKNIAENIVNQNI